MENTMMQRYATQEVPLIKVGNRRGLTETQIKSDAVLYGFFERFKHCFEHNFEMSVWLLVE